MTSSSRRTTAWIASKIASVAPLVTVISVDGIGRRRRTSRRASRRSRCAAPSSPASARTGGSARACSARRARAAPRGGQKSGNPCDKIHGAMLLGELRHQREDRRADVRELAVDAPHDVCAGGPSRHVSTVSGTEERAPSASPPSYSRYIGIAISVMREHVGREQHAGDESAEKHVRPRLLQGLHRDETAPDQQHRGNRHLERQAEREENAEHEAQDTR